MIKIIKEVIKMPPKITPCPEILVSAFLSSCSSFSLNVKGILYSAFCLSYFDILSTLDKVEITNFSRVLLFSK